jgi:hypothetical protein
MIDGSRDQQRKIKLLCIFHHFFCRFIIQDHLSVAKMFRRFSTSVSQVRKHIFDADVLAYKTHMRTLDAKTRLECVKSLHPFVLQRYETLSTTTVVANGITIAVLSVMWTNPSLPSFVVSALSFLWSFGEDCKLKGTQNILKDMDEEKQ